MFGTNIVSNLRGYCHYGQHLLATFTTFYEAIDMIVPRPTDSPQAKAIYMIVKENEILQREHAQPLPILDPTAVLPLWKAADYHAAIGSYQGLPVFMLAFKQPPALPGFAMQPLRGLLHRIDTELFSLAGRACQVAYFVRTHNFCSFCGDALEEVSDELAVYCARCDYRTYPRISPCIIVAVYRGYGPSAEILLARGIRHPEGLYSVLAGFVESGESLEQTLVREVAEETGVQVGNIEYVNSQPWPFPHSLMMGFLAEYETGSLVLDEKEILAADWFSFNDLPMTPPAGTIAANLIEAARIRVKA